MELIILSNIFIFCYIYMPIVACYLEKCERRNRCRLLSLGSLQSCWADKVSILTTIITFITIFTTDIIIPGLALNTLDTLTHFILTIILGNRYYFYTHSTDATTEASQKVTNSAKMQPQTVSDGAVVRTQFHQPPNSMLFTHDSLLCLQIQLKT